MTAQTQPYTAEGFVAELDQVRRRLADLYTVDRSLEFLRQNSSFLTPDEGVPTLDTPVGPIGPVGGYRCYTFTLGREHPFDFSIYAADGGPDPGLITTRSDFEDWARGELIEIGAVGDTLAYREYESYLEETDRLRSVDPEHLRPVNEELDDQHIRLRLMTGEDFGAFVFDEQRWRGDSADAFRRNFYGRYDQARTSQAWAMERISEAVAASAKTTAYAQGCLMSAVSAASGHLENLLKQRAGQNQDGGAAEFLVLVSSGAGLASSVAAGSPPAAGAFGTVAAVSGLAAGLFPSPGDEVEERTFAGDSAEAVAEHLHRHLADIKDAHTRRLDAVADQVAGLRRQITAADREGRMHTKAPGLDGSYVTPAEFHHDSSGLAP